MLGGEDELVGLDADNAYLERGMDGFIDEIITNIPDGIFQLMIDLCAK